MISTDVFICLMIIGIELVSETTEEEQRAAEGDIPELTKGVSVAYTKPVQNKVRPHMERDDRCNV